MSLPFLLVKFCEIGVLIGDIRVESVYCQNDDGSISHSCEGHFWIYPNPSVTSDQIRKMEKICEDFKRVTLYYGSAEICYEKELA